MRKPLRLALVAVMLVATLFAATPASAHNTRVTIGPCQKGTLPSGALSLICVPTSGWNGDLIVWGHGYVAYNQPLGFYNISFDNVYLPTLAESLGYAFAATSYRKNGLAILEGIDDVTQLVAAVPAVAGRAPTHTYMLGASEGGIITTLLIERHPELFSGGLAMCGPIGSFAGQLHYWGDFRVLFDAFFPGLVPGGATSVPQSVIDNWDTVYQPAIQRTIPASPTATAQLFSTSHAPVDPKNPSTTALSTTLDLMWYAVFATNDGVQELGGVPYDNTKQYYKGSLDDPLLNLVVQRVHADPAAVNAVKNYETSGNLTLPLVTLHTTGDDVIPFWHELLYKAKVHTSGNGSLTQIPVSAYGHCNFTLGEVLGAFGILVSKVTGHAPAGLDTGALAQMRRDLVLTRLVGVRR